MSLPWYAMPLVLVLSAVVWFVTARQVLRGELDGQATLAWICLGAAVLFAVDHHL